MTSINNPISLKGPNVIINPVFTGLEFKNKFKVERNDSVLSPLVESKNIEYSKFNKAYPQK